MKARLTHHAAPWLIALGMLVCTPACAERAPGTSPSATSVPSLQTAQAATTTPRLAWDRVGAPLQGMV